MPMRTRAVSPYIAATVLAALSIFLASVLYISLKGASDVGSGPAVSGYARIRGVGGGSAIDLVVLNSGSEPAYIVAFGILYSGGCGGFTGYSDIGAPVYCVSSPSDIYGFAAEPRARIDPGSSLGASIYSSAPPQDLLAVYIFYIGPGGDLLFAEARTQ